MKILLIYIFMMMIWMLVMKDLALGYDYYSAETSGVHRAYLWYFILRYGVALGIIGMTTSGAIRLLWAGYVDGEIAPVILFLTFNLALFGFCINGFQGSFFTKKTDLIFFYSWPFSSSVLSSFSALTVVGLYFIRFKKSE